MSAALKLEVFHNGQLLQEVALDGDLWVGRDENCSVHLEDRAISRKHALFRSTDNGVHFEKKSKFGWARVNGNELTQAILKSGDRVEMGPYELRCVTSQHTVRENSAALDLPEIKLPNVSVAELTQETKMLPNDFNDDLNNDLNNDLGNDLAGVLPEVQVMDEAPILDSFDSKDLFEPNISQNDNPVPPSEAILQTNASPEVRTLDAPADFDFLGKPFGTSEPEPEPVLAASENPPMDATAPILPDPNPGFDNEVSSNHLVTGVTRKINLAAQIRPVLLFEGSAGGPETFPIEEEEISIGRSQNCHVILGDKKSSRKHALIRKVDSQYILKDLGSANGTLVNSKRVEGEIPLESGAKIQIGDTSFVFQLVQADFAQKKQQFIPVPEQERRASESKSIDELPLAPMNLEPTGQLFRSSDFGAPPMGQESPPLFNEEAVEEKKESFIGRALQRYRLMSTRQQIIYGILVLVGLYLLFEDEPEEVKPVTRAKQAQKSEASKEEGGLPRFESLTPEQQRYIEAQYQMGFDLYKNREYDKSIFELEKIFRLVQDYKQAREIYSYAIEGKRQLEAREEERRKKEKEAQDRLKLQSLLDQAGKLMERRKYTQAEALFPEIELIEPENSAVATWRKIIAGENDRLEAEAKEKQRISDLKAKAMEDLEIGLKLRSEGRYYEAIDQFEEILDRFIQDRKLNQRLDREVAATYRMIAQARDPWLAKGKRLEAEGKLTEAYAAYEEAQKADPEDELSKAGMGRIRGTLTARAKYVYTEGVFAESYNDFETAEKRFREVLTIVPKDDDYYEKSERRLKKITVFKKPIENDRAVSSEDEGES